MAQLQGATMSDGGLSLMLIGSLGLPELVIILIIVVVVFGATKLPQLGDGLGRAIKNFKRAVNAQSEIDVSPGAKDKKGELDDDVEPSKPAK
jgi:sec-independent protein translocase protein TatA